MIGTPALSFGGIIPQNLTNPLIVAENTEGTFDETGFGQLSARFDPCVIRKRTSTRTVLHNAKCFVLVVVCLPPLAHTLYQATQQRPNLLHSIPSVFATFALTIAVITQPAWAQTQSKPPWLGRDYPYTVVDQDVQEVLEQFGRNLSIPVAIADNVDGRVNGRIEADNAQSFLDQVCAANNLAWFFDGSVIHVSNADDLTSQVFDLSPQMDPDRTMTALDAMKIGQPLTLNKRGNTIKAAGPHTWVAAVTSTIQRLTPAPKPVTGGAPQVRVFRGGVETRSSGAPKGATRE